MKGEGGGVGHLGLDFKELIKEMILNNWLKVHKKLSIQKKERKVDVKFELVHPCGKLMFQN